MKSKTLIYLAAAIIVLTIILSGLVVFTYEEKNHDPDYQKSWVVIYMNDLENPQEGVTIENHLGKDTNFTICIVPDSNDILEPDDLTCSLDNSFEVGEIEILTGEKKEWLIPPMEEGRNWVVLEYVDNTGKSEAKYLSFTQ